MEPGNQSLNRMQKKEHAKTCQKAVSRSDPLQGSDKKTTQENGKTRLSLFEETKTLYMVKMIAMRVMV